MSWRTCTHGDEYLHGVCLATVWQVCNWTFTAFSLAAGGDRSIVYPCARSVTGCRIAANQRLAWQRDLRCSAPPHCGSSSRADCVGGGISLCHRWGIRARRESKAAVRDQSYRCTMSSQKHLRLNFLVDSGMIMPIRAITIVSNSVSRNQWKYVSFPRKLAIS